MQRARFKLRLYDINTALVLLYALVSMSGMLPIYFVQLHRQLPNEDDTTAIQNND